MPATERFSLIVESATRGEADVRRMEQALNRVADVAERSAQRTADSAKRSSEASRKVGDDSRAFAASIRGAIENPLGAAGQAAESFALQFGKVGLAVTAGAGAFVAISGAAVTLVKNVGDAAEQLINFSDRTGLSIGQADRLYASAKIAGVGLSGLETAAKGLAGALSGTGGDKAADGLRKLGVSAYTATGAQRELGEVTIDVIEALSRVDNNAERVALGVAILGRGAQDLQPLIRNFKDLDETARALGFGTREKLLKDLAAAGDEIDKLGLRWEIAKAKFAAPIAAVITVTIKGAENLDKLLAGAGGLAGFGKDLVTSGGNIPLAIGKAAGGLFASTLDFDAITQPSSILPNLTPAQLADLRRQFPGVGDDALRRLALARGAPSPRRAPQISAPRFPDVGQVQQRFASERAQGLTLAAGFRRDELGRESGIEKRIAEIKEERERLQAALSSGAITDDKSFRELDAEFKRLEAEQKQLSERLKALKTIGDDDDQFAGILQKAVAAGLSPLEKLVLRTDQALAKTKTARQKALVLLAEQLELENLFREQSEKRPKLLFSPSAEIGEDAARILEKRTAETAPLVVFRPDQKLLEAQTGIDRARIEGELEKEKRARAFALAAFKQSEEFQIRKVELLSGPGGELDAIQRIAALRFSNLEQEKVLSGEILDLDLRRLQILEDAQIRALELQRKRLEDFQRGIKDTSGQVFDALLASGRGGARDFAAGQLRVIQRQLFQNLSVELFSGVSGKLAIPGQRDKEGKPNLLGRILTGTPFADNQVKVSTDRNTLATELNTQSIQAMTAAVGGGVSAPLAASGIPGLPALLPGLDALSKIPKGVFQGGTGLIFSNQPLGAVSSVPAGLGSVPLFLPPAETAKPSFSTQYGSRGTTAAVDAAAVTAGAFGVKSGIQQGGARGTLNAVAAGLATAAVLDQEPVSKAILIIAASTASAISALLGDPKQIRDRRINEAIEAATVEEPESKTIEVTTRGTTFDSDKTGTIRDTGERLVFEDRRPRPEEFQGGGGAEFPQPQITIQVQTLDAKSFMDNSGRIADAVNQAMRYGHAINRTAREAVLAQ